MRSVNDGKRFSAGDRELVAVTPPVFHSPTTRGLFDIRTGVYWAAPAFACPAPHVVDDVAELGDDFWPEPFTAAHALISS
jgi:flavorubredoxin